MKTKEGYEHDLQSVSEACGFSEGYTDELVSRMNEISDKHSKQSLVIQEFEETFTKRELAYVMVANATANREREARRQVKDALSGLLSKLGRDLK